MCSGWTPHSRLHRLHYEGLQPDPSGHLRWQEITGDQSSHVCFPSICIKVIRYSSSSVNHVCFIGDRLFCHAALLRCEEDLREDHAFPHMGGSERRRFCTRNGPSRGGASQPKS